MDNDRKNKIGLGGLAMILSLALKIGLYMLGTEVNYARPAIFIISFGISALIVLSLDRSKLKHKRGLKNFFYIVFSFIVFADVMHYSYFQSLASVNLLKQASQVGAIGDSIKELLSLRNILLLVDIPIVLYLANSKRTRELELGLVNTRGLKTALLLVPLGCYIYMLAGGKYPVLANKEFYSYHIKDLGNIVASAERLDEEDYRLMEEIEKENHIDEKNRKYHGIAKGKNLIVIQVESLQNFVIGMKYKDEEVTPNLNRLIEDKGSLYFDEYYQLVGRGNTSDAEMISNNSLHPSMEEYTYMQYEKNKYYGLPWILRENGYNSWVYHGYEKEFWNREKAYPNQGFEKFLSQDDFKYEVVDTIGFGISDEKFFEQSLEYMKEQKAANKNGPIHSFLITLSNHTPYKLHPAHYVLDIDEKHNNIVGDYLHSVRYTDQELGKFIEGLKKEGLYEDSVIVLYGDHFGVNHYNQDVYEPMKDLLGQDYEVDHVMNIPLIIHVPGEELGEKISKVGSQIDLLPTMLNLLGLENEKGFMFGKDLVNYQGYNFVPTQTVMPKGSFIDKDVIFKFSTDGMFEHSRAIDRKTRQEVDIEELRPKYEKALREIDLGDKILKNNLMEEILKNRRYR